MIKEIADSIKMASELPSTVMLDMHTSLHTVSGEGKRVSAALVSAGSRHADNVSISAYKMLGDKIELIISSAGGEFSLRKFEIHITVNKTHRESAMLITSSTDGTGMFRYDIPPTLAWIALVGALIKVGEIEAAQSGEVESVEIGGYLEPAQRECEGGMSEEQYLQIGSEILEDLIEEAMNGPEAVDQALVIRWNPVVGLPKPQRTFENCPNTCEAEWQHEFMCIAPAEPMPEKEEHDIPSIGHQRAVPSDMIVSHYMGDFEYQDGEADLGDELRAVIDCKAFKAACERRYPFNRSEARTLRAGEITEDFVLSVENGLSRAKSHNQQVAQMISFRRSYFAVLAAREFINAGENLPQSIRVPKKLPSSIEEIDRLF